MPQTDKKKKPRQKKKRLTTKQIVEDLKKEFQEINTVIAEFGQELIRLGEKIDKADTSNNSLKRVVEVFDEKIEETVKQAMLQSRFGKPEEPSKQVTPSDPNVPIPISIPGLEPDVVEAINVFKLPSGEIRAYTKRKLETKFWKHITNILKTKGFTWHSDKEKEEWYWTDKPEPEDTQQGRRNNGRRRDNGRRSYRRY